MYIVVCCEHCNKHFVGLCTLEDLTPARDSQNASPKLTPDAFWEPPAVSSGSKKRQDHRKNTNKNRKK